MDSEAVSECQWCHVQTREVVVLVGAPPGHEAPMRIDVEPHPDGRVIQRRDGTFRLLGDVRFRAPNIAGYRVHGSTMDECEGSHVEATS